MIIEKKITNALGRLDAGIFEISKLSSTSNEVEIEFTIEESDVEESKLEIIDAFLDEATWLTKKIWLS